jgi:hypothetical protein
LRQGAIKTRVFKNGGPYKALRELARTHRMVVRDVVRTKNCPIIPNLSTTSP